MLHCKVQRNRPQGKEGHNGFTVQEDGINVYVNFSCDEYYYYQLFLTNFSIDFIITYTVNSTTNQFKLIVGEGLSGGADDSDRRLRQGWHEFACRCLPFYYNMSK